MLWQYLQGSEWAKINQHILSFANVFFQAKEVKKPRNLVHVQSQVEQLRVHCVAEAQACCFVLRNIKIQFAIIGSIAKLLIHV